MDVACGEYGDVISGLVSAIENGRLIYQENSTLVIATPSLNPGKEYRPIVNFLAEISEFLLPFL
jgi:hypothetical protein